MNIDSLFRFLSLVVLCFDLCAASVNHRLINGEKLNVECDINKILRQDNPNLRGVAIHSLSGFWRHPYSTRGKWQLEDTLTESIKALQLANSRVLMHTRYKDGEEILSQEQLVDRAIAMYKKFNVPINKVVICLNNDLLNDSKRIIEIVDHGFKQGLVRWELGSQPWANGFTDNAKDYHTQALAVAKAIRAYSNKIFIYAPARNTMGKEWGEGTLQALAGYYDFIAAHNYTYTRFYKCTFEGLTLTENYKILQNILDMNTLIDAHNPNKKVHQWDTQWGNHSDGYDKNGEPKEPALASTKCIQNSNMQGTLHRAVRLIYYHRENFMKGAMQWEMFCRQKAPGFGILSRDVPDKAFMPYWLLYHFDRFVGEDILDIAGTCPYYTATNKEHHEVQTSITGPLSPVLASLSKDKQELYYIIANGSSNKSVASTLHCNGFTPQSVSGIILSEDDYQTGSPLVENESDFVKPFQAAIIENAISCKIPPHCIVMIKAKRK